MSPNDEVHQPRAIETPEFATEADEALWWEQNEGLLLREFEEAAAQGTLGLGTLAQHEQPPAITIRLDPHDVEMAKAQAQERGLRYQTYLKRILHQALVAAAK